MTRYKIVYSQEAFGDLSVIYHYIALQSLDLKIAGRFIKTLKNAIESLRVFPSRHQRIGLSFRGATDVRQFVTNNYLILYSINEAAKTVAIIGIISCKQEIN